MNMRALGLYTGSFLLAFQVSSAFAADANVDALAKALEEQGQKLEAQQKALAAEQQKLADQQADFNALKDKIEKLSGKKIAAQGASGSTPVKTVATNSNSSNSVVNNPINTTPPANPQEVGTDRKQNTPEKPPETAKYIEEGGILLPKGKLLITPSIEYDHSGATNVAIDGFSIIPALNIGTFDISQVEQNTLMGSVDALLGVTNRFELEAKVPYVYSTQSTLGRPIGAGSSTNSLTSIDGQGLGDIELGAHYQINQPKDNMPFFVANLRFKTTTGDGPFESAPNNFGLVTKLPTGSGFYALQPSVTAIFPSDPVVFYGNLGYLHSFERSFATYGDIEPGDSINGSFGMSLSLNDATSISLGYSHNFVMKTKQNGSYLPGSSNLEVGSLDVGWSYILNDKVSLNLNVSAGVTSDAPDDRVILRVPVSFDAF